MRGDFCEDADLSIFLLEEDIDALEKGSTLENTLLYKENEEESEMHVQVKRSRKDKYFIKVKPPVFGNLLEVKSLEISLNKDAINYLKNGEGLISYFSHHDIRIYFPSYQFFDLLYNRSKDEHNNT